MMLFRLFSVVVPLVMVGIFVIGVVLILRPSKPRVAAPLPPGQTISLQALLMPDARPGTVISLAQVQAPSGRISLTSHELIWEPADGAVAPWRAPLAQVHVVQRPPLATGWLILSVQGRLLGLVVDTKKRPNRFMRNTVADLRHGRTGAWFADTIEATSRQAASWAPPPQPPGDNAPPPVAPGPAATTGLS